MASKMPKGMPPKKMPMGQHKMPGGKMMSDAEMAKMHGKPKKGKD